MNTLTGLINFVYDSVDVVSREQVGFLPAVYKNPTAEMAAKNQEITYDIVPKAQSYDITPAMDAPALDDSEVPTGSMAISKVKGVKFHWTGDDEVAIGRNVKLAVHNNKFSQAFRTLANEMEGDLAALYKYASRGYGTAGTTPFGTAGDFTDASEVVKILKDNGAPTGDMQLVINTSAGAKIIGKQSQVQMAGSADPLRHGVLLNTAGMSIRESAAVQAHVKGTGAAYITNGAVAKGIASVAVDGGTGTVLTGDVVSFADDGSLSKYLVNTGIAASGAITLAAPGAMANLADGKAMTLAGNYAANMAFSRDAIHLLTRLPKMPEGGDKAEDEMIVQDPISGIFFRVALYKGYHAVLIEVSVAWGVKAAKPEHMAILLG